MCRIFANVKPLDILASACALAALVSHVVGTATHTWWIVHEDDVLQQSFTFYYGIWVVVDCKNHTCVTLSSGMQGRRAWLLGPAVLLVMAAILMLVVLVTSSLLLALPWHHRHARTLRKLGVIFNIGAGVIIILAVLIFYKKKAGLRPSTAPETSNGNPGWSLLLSTVGGILAIADAVVIGITVNRYSHKKMEKLKTIFGIYAADLEIDVNALRQGVLRQGRKVNITSLNDSTLEDFYKATRVEMHPVPGSPCKANTPRNI
ncbi:uncharacterized protein LOC127831157 [Dreissena polymorpha]|uniref:Uncharacterized protein n=1 Tax=Dreissena polymorpha TaxID=45954 RepID=A0A9D4MV28_DREPO|nr:uncharacterized protein LOC127831157 [Dreissena polymorpha]KAH3882394.1 hypothetical protein DPMN_006332 [Dreissena polymorpha]